MGTLQDILQFSHPLFYLFYAKFTMLERPGDLIPVLPNATSIPWTRRRSQILNFLHRGPVTFQTLVYDTNVGDISALATYFNPDRISERELNLRFGHHPTSGEKHASGSPPKPGNDPVVKPRLLLYPDHNLNSSQVKVQRTLNWVLSQDSDSGTGSGTSGQSTPEPGMIQPPPPVQQMKRTEVDNNLNVSDSLPTPVTSKPFAMPTSSMNTVLDSVWTDQGTCQSGNWPDREEAGLGLGQLVTRVNKNTELLDTLEMLETGGDKLWGAWDSSRDQAW